MTLAVLGAQRLGISGGAGPETVLTERRARAPHARSASSKGSNAQLRLLDSMPEAHAARPARARRSSRMTSSTRSWRRCSPPGRRGDVERLAALIDEDARPSDRELHRLLFTNRNAAWAALDRRAAGRGRARCSSRSAPAISPARDSVQAALARARHRAPSGCRTSRRTDLRRGAARLPPGPSPIGAPPRSWSSLEA